MASGKRTLGYDRRLYILAFDHRGSFQKKMFGIEGDPTAEETATIADAKHLIYEGMVEAVKRGAQASATGVLVDYHAGCARLGTPAHCLLHALEDQPLGRGDRFGLLGRGVALDAEHLLLERPAVVEREDVQLAVVAQSHLCPFFSGECARPVYGQPPR